MSSSLYTYVGTYLLNVIIVDISKKFDESRVGIIYLRPSVTVLKTYK